MGEIKKYDEAEFVFLDRHGAEPSQEVLEIKSLKSGEYWIEDHICDATTVKCALRIRLGVAAIRYFGKGNYSVNHRDGIIAVLRKA